MPTEKEMGEAAKKGAVRALNNLIRDRLDLIESNSQYVNHNLDTLTYSYITKQLDKIYDLTIDIKTIIDRIKQYEPGDRL